MRFVSRASWGARPPRHRTGLTPSGGTTVHYEGPRMGTFPHESCASKVRAIQNFHMDERGWSDIAYTAVVCPHGWVFEGRWIGVRTGANGTHPGNAAWYAVCALIGAGDAVTSEMRSAFVEVCDHLRQHGRAGADVNGHRDHKPTACPGDLLYADVQAGTFERTPTTPPRPQPPDDEEAQLMAAKDEIIAAVGVLLDELAPKALRVTDGPHKGQVWIVSAEGRWHVPDRETLDVLYVLHAIRRDEQQTPPPIKWAQIDGLPELAG